MCERCHAETDTTYTGDSLEAKRRQAIRTILDRHPALGLDPENVTFRFAPKAEAGCVRVNPTTTPQYEIHTPQYLAQAMSDSPPLSGIAMAAWIASDQSYADICDILAITPHQPYDALFVSETPPVNFGRASDAHTVQQYEHDLHDR